jgi:HTH-type transcriptional regulator / antitoxin HigA
MSLNDPDITSAVAHWRELADAVFVPHTEAEYLRLVAVLDRLIDEVGEEERHPLASLMEVLGVLIERYEAEHVPEFGSGDEPQFVIRRQYAPLYYWRRKSSRADKILERIAANARE